MSEIRNGYDRVTNILSKFSGLDRIDPEVLANAAARGTLCHILIDAHILDSSSFSDKAIERGVGCYSRDPEHYKKEIKLVTKMMQSYFKWAEGKVFIKKPDRFYDDEYLITGECDQIYQTKEGLVLVDFKTPAAESKTWFLQASAYHYMAHREGYFVERVEFIQLDRTGGCAKTYTYKTCWELFEAVLDTYRYFYKDEKQDIELDYI